MKDARILCVDDEPNVLEGLERILRRKCSLLTATSGAEALSRLARPEPIDVVVSDMRMPEMDGATLLTECRTRSPDTVRILLTGHADLDSAIRVVNQGQLFRYLTKPCPPQEFLEAIAAAVDQGRRSTQERALFEQSVVGTVRALTELIALVHPGSLASASRLLERARKVAAYLRVCDAWHVEVAAVLSHSGYVVLPGDLLAKAVDPASPKHGQSMLTRVPLALARVLSVVPRLDLAQAALKYQGRPFESRGPGPQREEIPIGARILRALSDLALEETRVQSTLAALNVLRSTQDSYDPVVLHAIAAVCVPQPPPARTEASASGRGGHGAGA